eukprot:Gb_20536 [translate_table: standard]
MDGKIVGWKKEEGVAGEWLHTTRKWNGDPNDKGIQTHLDASFFAISTEFLEFSNKDKTLPLQFSVKHEQKLDCGNGYVKLISEEIDQKKFGGETPYSIMFGPDGCGYSIKKVHLRRPEVCRSTCSRRRHWFSPQPLTTSELASPTTILPTLPCKWLSELVEGGSLVGGRLVRVGGNMISMSDEVAQLSEDIIAISRQRSNSCRKGIRQKVATNCRRRGFAGGLPQTTIGGDLSEGCRERLECLTVCRELSYGPSPNNLATF